MFIHLVLSRWVGGWVDGWVDGWMDGWMDVLYADTCQLHVDNQTLRILLAPTWHRATVNEFPLFFIL